MEKLSMDQRPSKVQGHFYAVNGLLSKLTPMDAVRHLPPGELAAMDQLFSAWAHACDAERSRRYKLDEERLIREGKALDDETKAQEWKRAAEDAARRTGGLVVFDESAHR